MTARATLTLDLRGRDGPVFLADGAAAVPLQAWLDPGDPARAVGAARAMAHEPLAGGGSLAGIRTAEGYPAWWIHAYVFYHGIGQTLPWNQAWLLGKAASSALARLRPGRLVLRGGTPDQVALVSELARWHGIRFQARDSLSLRMGHRLFVSHAERLKLLLRVANGTLALCSGSGPRPCEILFFTPGALRREASRWGQFAVRAIQDGLDARGVSHQTLFSWNRLHLPRFLAEAAGSGYFPAEGQFRARDLAAMAFRAVGPRLAPNPAGRLPGAEAYGLQGLFRRKLRHLHRWRVPETSQQVALFLRTLDRVRPRLVVLTDEADSQGLSLVSACRIRSVPTIAVQHGVLHPFHFGYVHDPADHRASPPFPLPDLTLVYGAYFREVLEHCGHFPPGSVRVTGSPGSDAMVRARALPRDPGFRERLGLSGRGPLVVLATQPLPDLRDRENILEATCRAMDRMPGGVLVVKPHPAEWDLAAHRAALRRHGLPELLLPEADLTDLFRHADLAVAQSSTTLIEALLLGCPAITLNLTGDPEILPYAGSGACLEARDWQSLAKGMIAMAGDPAFRLPYELARGPFLRSMLGDLDGCATGRVLEALMAFLE